MPKSVQASRICRNSPSASVSEKLWGTNKVAKNHLGIPPVQATSLAFTCTAYQPAISVAKVIGSLLATSSLSPRAMTAASSPIPGPTSTWGSVAGTWLSNRSSSWGGNLPNCKAASVSPRMCCIPA